MEIIPVIDVRHGIAVAAVAGERARYLPLESPFAKRPDPVAVALGLLSLFPFKTLYVADLDGIEGRGGNVELPARLAEALPRVALWIDDGSAGAADSGPMQARTVVIGSESLGSPSPRLRGEGWGEGQKRAPVQSAALHPDPLPMKNGERESAPWVLSLDFRGDAFLGPAELLDRPELWPDRVIVMTLARVGCGEGPDLARISEISAKGRGRRIYAAGGVRDVGDLEAARRAGAAGALVARALHEGTIKAGDLEKAAGL